MPVRPVHTALVTGASGAFGSATADALRGRGVRVVGLDRVSAPGVIRCDVSDSSDSKAAVSAAIEELGTLDALVHCAGVGPATDIGAEPGGDVRDALEVNLLGAWRVTSAAMPALTQGLGRGRVVLVSSLLAHVTVPFAGAYCVSKRAVVGYADALRIEYGGQLAVTSVLPGYVDTPIHARSRAAGVALDGLVPAETVGHVTRTILRVLAANKPPRETATSPTGQVVRVLARHAPGLVDKAVVARSTRHLLAGGFAGSALGDAWRQRYAGRTEEVTR